MTAGAFWILFTRRDGAATVVDVAPCGDYQRRRSLRLSGDTAATWERVLERPANEFPGVAFLGDWGLPESLWSLPTNTFHRPILLAQGPAKRPFGSAALEGASGENLASILGLTLSQLVESFETHNLSHLHDASRAEREHAACRFLDGRDREGSAATDRRRPLVVLGPVVEAALVAAAGSLRWVADAFSGYTVVSHPSGHNPLLKIPDERRKLREGLVLALVKSRRFASDEAAGLVANVIADGHHGSWVELRRHGVVAPGRGVADPWVCVAGGDEQKFERQWREGRAVVMGPPWKFGLADRVNEWTPYPGRGADRVGALLLAERVARDRGWTDPWEARNRDLDEATKLGPGEATNQRPPLLGGAP